MKSLVTRFNQKLGACRRCMALSFSLTSLSILGLFSSLILNVPPVILASSVATGAFGTLSILHITAYLFRRMGKLGSINPSRQGCCA